MLSKFDKNLMQAYMRQEGLSLGAKVEFKNKLYVIDKDYRFKQYWNYRTKFVDKTIRLNIDVLTGKLYIEKC